MKTEIVPRMYNRTYELVERTISKDMNEDNKIVRVIGRGFVPYLMFQELQRPILKGLFDAMEKDVTPTRNELFNDYFEKSFLTYDIPGGKAYKTPDGELKEQFKTTHAETERKEFETLPEEYQDKYSTLFDEYMAWVTGQKIQAIKEYDSIVRATAFCIMLMLKAGKVDNDTLQSRKKIVSMVKDQFPERSGATVYAALRTEDMIYSQFETKCVEFAPDYEYGKKLYNEKYPD